ncbi:MAG: MotA/TolQ/ExbB proton channel family protein [Myxococcota bacterium]
MNALRLIVLVTLSLLPMLASAAPPRSWAEARTDEARTLEAERDALRKTLSATKGATASTKASLRKDIDGLTAELTRLQLRAATLEADMPARERDRSSTAQANALTDLVARLSARANAPIADDADARAAALPGLLRSVLETIEHDGSLHIESKAEVFDASGQAANATVLHLGRVGAVQWDENAAPLIATAEGLQVVRGVFDAPSGQGGVQAVTAVLYDAGNPPAPDAFVVEGWRAKMNAGGPVMWVLLGIGALAGLIVLERTFGLVWARQRWNYEQRRFAKAVETARTSTLLHVKGWIAKPLVIAAAARCPSCSATVDVDVEERAAQALMVMREQLQRRLSLVNVAAGVAPLLGLLGTVTGMIHTFSVVTESGTAEPQLLAAGISEALLTTQFGLAIAIPAYLAHALLSRGARRILASAEQAVLAYLHGEGHGHARAHEHPSDDAHERGAAD